jgi:hypothetical protein
MIDRTYNEGEKVAFHYNGKKDNGIIEEVKENSINKVQGKPFSGIYYRVKPFYSPQRYLLIAHNQLKPA